MSYQVLLTPRTVKELKEIMQLGRDYADTALRELKRLRDGPDSLPNKVIFDEAHVTTISPYRILYSVYGDRIVIARIEFY